MDISFICDGSAFEDGNKELEIVRILGNIALKVSSGLTEGSIFDINGNIIGQWRLH